MSDVSRLTDPQVLLQAVQLASTSDLDRLLHLHRLRQNILSTTVIYRILLSFYPVNQLKLSDLATFLLSLQDPARDALLTNEFKVDPSISALSRKDALRRCRLLTLRPNHHHTIFGSENALANFVLNWSYRVQSVGGIQPLLTFVEPFLDHDPALRLWYSSCLVPAVRLQYDFYPDSEDTIGLQEFQSLSGVPGVKTLLHNADMTHDPTLIARDLGDVVTPWVHGTSEWKRRRVEPEPAEDTGSEWDSVNQWLLSASAENFVATGKAYLQWNGPKPTESDPDSRIEKALLAGFAQTGLAIIYAGSELSKEALVVSQNVVAKVARIAGELPLDSTSTSPDITLDGTLAQSLKESDLLPTVLLRPENPFTQVKKSSLDLIQGLLLTADHLLQFDLPAPISTLAKICLFGSERQQKDELGRILQRFSGSSRSQVDWVSAWHRLHWSRRWTSQDTSDYDGTQYGLLSKMSSEELDARILDAALNSGQFEAVAKIYFDAGTPRLPVAEIETHVADAILRAYDNAADGNRERGGLRPAYEMLKFFRLKLPQSSKLEDIDHLIKATHRLSFYRLNLSHGIPFRPVAIRVQKNPINLVAKVLEQDPKSYTKLDDLLEIGRSLVLAHLPSRMVTDDALDPLGLGQFQAEHEITRLAIEAALRSNDFDTAYSYITTRLSTGTSSDYHDDISWRAAYAAGKYRPSATPKSLDARIENLSRRMELLSRALVLAPVGDSLAEILGTWRRHEEEMAALREEGVQEERASDARADADLPGAFGLDDRELDAAESQRAMARRAWPGATPGLSYEEHAPMGLFDVAKGAASALRKSSFFPLGSTGLQDLQIRDAAMSSTQHGFDVRDSAPGSPPTGERVRKRDQVTNMVTSGIVSGMGWVLGAQAQDRNDFKSNGKSHDEQPSSRGDHS
ncbi:hypothetical protein LTR84_007156 [Exophiala bonariae]|uniref:Sec39 domain-containing protein n=1 Tax=Exophiala bonariae TaxID=1690606 RepID=A0AAV9MZ69_9EURO|nr:hypothetical protein LTR84_007156 [Exophiala bonariae]